MDEGGGHLAIWSSLGEELSCGIIYQSERWDCDWEIVIPFGIELEL